jgi:hypothetical protein
MEKALKSKPSCEKFAEGYHGYVLPHDDSPQRIEIVQSIVRKAMTEFLQMVVQGQHTPYDLTQRVRNR